MAFKVPEGFRVEGVPTTRMGEFHVPVQRDRKGVPTVYARTRASMDLGWEHVSVTIIGASMKRSPTWEEMCEVKRWFWDDEDMVIQIHPAKSSYVNEHPFCLHLWKPSDPGLVVPKPPSFLVR